MRYIVKWFERLAVNAKAATVLGSIPASYSYSYSYLDLDFSIFVKILKFRLESRHTAPSNKDISFKVGNLNTVIKILNI